MNEFTAADFSEVIAERISAEHVSLAARWLERLRTLLPVEANEIFPTEHLLDHIPALIRQIADHLREPDQEAVAANSGVVAKAQQLGELRHSQRASVHQLLAEYRLLGGILANFVEEELDRLGLSPAASEAVALVRRLQEAIWILSQATVNTFVAEYTRTIADHAARLESFNRLVSHELRQPLGTLMYALPLLKAAVDEPDQQRRAQYFEVMDRNIRRLSDQIERLEAMSRLQTRSIDALDIQKIHLVTLAREVARQLREMADARAVDIRVSDDLPDIVVDVARLELILVNLVSNAIKYSDPAKQDRYVAVDTAESSEPDQCVVVVRDNGLGIPKEHHSSIFDRFFRAHAERDGELRISGSGLGLAIVADCVDAIGGTLRVESVPGEGTTFFLMLPRDPGTRT